MTAYHHLSRMNETPRGILSDNSPIGSWAEEKLHTNWLKRLAEDWKSLIESLPSTDRIPNGQLENGKHLMIIDSSKASFSIPEMFNPGP